MLEAHEKSEWNKVSPVLFELRVTSYLLQSVMYGLSGGEGEPPEPPEPNDANPFAESAEGITQQQRDLAKQAAKHDTRILSRLMAARSDEEAKAILSNEQHPRRPQPHHVDGGGSDTERHGSGGA